MNPKRDLGAACIVALALVALTLKLAIAYNTIGTNDAVFFYGFAKILNQHGLEFTYQHSRYFNHPPLTAYYLRGILALSEQPWCQATGIHFPFLLRLPGIVADFLVVLILLKMAKTGVLIPTWALALFAISPVSLMVSGFHGNTDPVMVLFLVCAAFMCLRGNAAVCGLFFALSCQVKVIPLLLLPVFFFFWVAHGSGLRFSAVFMTCCVVLWAQPIFQFPILFAKNVLLYGSYWGEWGITYCLRLTHWRPFNGGGSFDLPVPAVAAALLLKVAIVAAVFAIAFRHRNLNGRGLIDSVAYAWIIFFLLSPGVCVQYMVWLAPFILVLSSSFYLSLTVSSSIFLFVFYNTIARGFPWFVAISDQRNLTWVPWALLPWIVLIVGPIALWWKTADGKLDLPLFRSRNYAPTAPDRACERNCRGRN
jgi:hypothetical protein